jgi:hypothetical protein
MVSAMTAFPEAVEATIDSVAAQIFAPFNPVPAPVEAIFDAVSPSVQPFCEPQLAFIFGSLAQGIKAGVDAFTSAVQTIIDGLTPPVKPAIDSIA